MMENTEVVLAFSALKVIKELKKTNGKELKNSPKWDIMMDAMRLHRLYHEFSMKEKVDGEFDRVLVSLLSKVAEQTSENP